MRENEEGTEKRRHVTFLREPRVIGAFRVKVDDDPARRVAAGRMEHPFFMQYFINTSHELFIGSRDRRVPRVINYRCKYPIVKLA